jgi:hypothetical protein
MTPEASPFTVALFAYPHRNEFTGTVYQPFTKYGDDAVRGYESTKSADAIAVAPVTPICTFT